MSNNDLVTIATDSPVVSASPDVRAVRAAFQKLVLEKYGATDDRLREGLNACLEEAIRQVESGKVEAPRSSMPHAAVRPAWSRQGFSSVAADVSRGQRDSVAADGTALHERALQILDTKYGLEGDPTDEQYTATLAQAEAETKKEPDPDWTETMRAEILDERAKEWLSERRIFEPTQEEYLQAIAACEVAAGLRYGRER